MLCEVKVELIKGEIGIGKFTKFNIEPVEIPGYLKKALHQFVREQKGGKDIINCDVQLLFDGFMKRDD
jgi:hypothetical protein